MCPNRPQGIANFAAIPSHEYYEEPTYEEQSAYEIANLSTELKEVETYNQGYEEIYEDGHGATEDPSEYI